MLAAANIRLELLEKRFSQLTPAPAKPPLSADASAAMHAEAHMRLELLDSAAMHVEAHMRIKLLEERVKLDRSDSMDLAGDDDKTAQMQTGTLPSSDMFSSGDAVRVFSHSNGCWFNDGLVLRVSGLAERQHLCQIRLRKGLPRKDHQPRGSCCGPRAHPKVLHAAQ